MFGEFPSGRLALPWRLLPLLVSLSHWMIQTRPARRPLHPSHGTRPSLKAWGNILPLSCAPSCTHTPMSAFFSLLLSLLFPCWALWLSFPILPCSQRPTELCSIHSEVQAFGYTQRASQENMGSKAKAACYPRLSDLSDQWLQFQRKPTTFCTTWFSLLLVCFHQEQNGLSTWPAWDSPSEIILYLAQIKELNWIKS